MRDERAFGKREEKEVHIQQRTHEQVVVASGHACGVEKMNETDMLCCDNKFNRRHNNHKKKLLIIVCVVISLILCTILLHGSARILSVTQNQKQKDFHTFTGTNNAGNSIAIGRNVHGVGSGSIAIGRWIE